MSSEQMVRNEFPNPIFERKNWLSLNGKWAFAVDPEDQLEAQGMDAISFDLEICVPFCCQSERSGLHLDEDDKAVFYTRTFSLEPSEKDGTVLLKFGAVDYRAKVWVNGKLAGAHEGGFTSFSLDITDFVQVGENRLTVKAEDSYSKEQPRGKQMWGKEPSLCWYRNTVGIWQSVWLEFTGSNYITAAQITPDIDHNKAFLQIRAKEEQDISVEARFSMKGRELGRAMTEKANGRCELSFSFNEHAAESVLDFYWTPEFPNLIDVELILRHHGKITDRVYTYFGMRKIHREGNRIFLNNQLLYQRLVLDQGYWPDGLMTAPSDEALRKDVELAKQLGFNGARKHQKIEDPRYYYWADKLGLLVWGELPSAYDYTPEEQNALIREMRAFVQRDYNHPCIVTWVPFNESWGVPQIADHEEQRNFVRSMYYMIKGEDPTRLVTSNDGWEQLETTDLCGIHDYDITPQNVEKRYENMEEIFRSSVNCRPVYARGVPYNGVPVLLTEIGGIKLAGAKGWGYHDAAEDDEKLLAYLQTIVGSIRRHPVIQGFCYTQLTDVQQETNGLADDERNLRLPAEQLKQIFG